MGLGRYTTATITQGAEGRGCPVTDTTRGPQGWKLIKIPEQ